MTGAMDTEARWDEPSTDRGVVERSFSVSGPSGRVPGLLWSPDSTGSPPTPLVLIGHGGSGHKRSERCLQLARWFATRARVAVLAIDGPYHGDRVVQPLSPSVYQSQMVCDGVDLVTDRMVDDWWTAVDRVGAAGLADTDRLAYLGLSMGTRFGLPLVASAGGRMRCAVLGKFGLSHTSAVPAGLRSDLVLDQARRVTSPVLFHLQWDDELFPRDGQLALFDLLGSRDKHVLAYAGPHRETANSALDAWCAFTASRLLGPLPSPDTGGVTAR